jgi:predicted PurR-regulated permease PerM
MLTGKDLAHPATGRLFPKARRLLAHRTIGRISKMIRSFLVANLVVGLVNAGVFWFPGSSA